MSSSLYNACCFAFVLPYLTIAAVLLHNSLRCARWKKRRRRDRAFCSSSAALGTILLFAQIFYRPSVSHVVEAQQHVDVDEEDSGDPESKARQLSRQLKRIRRGEPVEHLVLRL
jgi:hypothetical protein